MLTLPRSADLWIGSTPEAPEAMRLLLQVLIVFLALHLAIHSLSESAQQGTVPPCNGASTLPASELLPFNSCG